jgi:hypothetical protein
LTEHIEKVANELAVTLSRKNKDYAPTDEFSNFTLAGQLAGLTPWDAILIQIGIKHSRLLSLVSEGVSKPEFESVRDTLVDLAGYSVIAAAYLDREQEPKAWEG